ncbi:unnamed protein product, partial [Prorocentrum cordatum]
RTCLKKQGARVSSSRKQVLGSCRRGARRMWSERVLGALVSSARTIEDFEDHFANKMRARNRNMLGEWTSERWQEKVLEWASAAFAAANALFFGGRLAASGGVRLDPTWHRVRGGAGGSHPGEQIIVLDPSVHTSLRALCGTLLHEMVHLEVSPSGGGPEEHGREFVSRCLDVNAAVHRANEGGLGLGCACRLGELDLSLDRALLRACGAPADCLEDEDPLRIDDEEAAGQAGSPAAWGSGLLVGDLRAAGLEDGVCASVLSGAAVATCERALGTPGGFEAWDISEATGWRIAQAQTSPSTPHPLAPPPPLLPPPLLLLLLHLSLPLPPSCVFV